MDNAYWDGRAMYYGNGDQYFKPLATAIDVAGHEITHGVVQATANLKYQNESGAINESMADIFGCMMDSTDWLLGEDVVRSNYYPSGALRSMADPHNGGTSLNDNYFQPKHTAEQYFGSQDNGGVHINSGIPNHAFYKFATAINSRKKAAAIYYKALTNYLTASARFLDLRYAVIKATEDLYGVGSFEATQAALAFDAVGIGKNTTTPPVITPPSNLLPKNPGEESLLCYDVDPFAINGLISTADLNTYTTYTNKIVYSKPSVTDDGRFCVFVATDHKIKVIDLDPASSPNLSVVQDQAIWASVAVAKDGSKIAATTLDEDTSIYVFDLENGGFKRFKLYNPTFTEGVKSAGPVYADALDWAYDGQTLIFDCFNSLVNTNSASIEYWDINLIKVWDNNKNQFDEGEVVKLFNQLDQGESIGNPIFAKRASNVIAFDYENESTNEYAIFGLDLEKNDFDVITLNNTLGFPSFDSEDETLFFTGLGADNNEEIYGVLLNSDRISGADSPLLAVPLAKWGILYSLGERDINIGTEKLLGQQDQLLAFPNPSTGILTVQLNKNDLGETLAIHNSQGILIQQIMISSTTETVNLSNYPNGLYAISVLGEREAKTLKVCKN
jgi:bacillolysin